MLNTHVTVKRIWKLLASLLVVPLLGGPAVAQPEAPSPLPVADETTICTLPPPLGPLTYAPGRGLHVGNTGLALGGYTNVNLVRDEGAPAQLSWDDLSLFVIWRPLPRLRLFSELEFEDIVDVNDEGEGGTSNNQFTAERLFGDLAISDQLNLRVGKFLTPVGRWNVIHAQPLVWTTSRPLATQLAFDVHTTGAMLFGTFFPGVSSVTYSLYGQFANQLDPGGDDIHPADRAAGARIEYAGGDGWSVGASYYGSVFNGHWGQLGGLDTLVQRGRVEVMGEAVVEGGSQGLPGQGGLYLQGVFELLPTWFLVGRYEYYDQPVPEPTVNLFLPGLAYKPRPYMVFKLGYLFADHPAQEEPPGFQSSFAILF